MQPISLEQALKQHSVAIEALMSKELRPHWDLDSTRPRDTPDDAGLTPIERRAIHALVKWSMDNADLLPTGADVAKQHTLLGGAARDPHGIARTIRNGLEKLHHLYNDGGTPEHNRWSLECPRFQGGEYRYFLSAPASPPIRATSRRRFGGGTELDDRHPELHALDDRDPLLVLPEAWFRETWDNLERGTCSLLVAEPGSGKTTLLCGLAHHLHEELRSQSRGPHGVPLWLIRSQRRTSFDATEVIPVFVDALLSLSGAVDQSVLSLPIAQRLDASIRLWANAHHGARAAIIIDGLDEAIPGDADPGQSLLGYLPDHIPNNVTFIFASRPGRAADYIRRRYGSRCNEISWTPASEFVDDLIDAYATHMDRRDLMDDPGCRDTLHSLWAATGRRPALSQSVASRRRCRGSGWRLVRRLVYFVLVARLKRDATDYRR